MNTEHPQTSEEQRIRMDEREKLSIALTLLVGACRRPRITKAQIEKSLEEQIRRLREPS